MNQHKSKKKFRLKLCHFALLLVVVYKKSGKSVKNSRYITD